MCGRYGISAEPRKVAEYFRLAAQPELQPRFNIAPSQLAPVVRSDEAGRRELVRLRWGLIPAWADDPALGSRMINARAETIADKPAFRSAVRKRRCLVPADLFYEWAKPAGASKRRQPVCIRRRDRGLFAFAGVWERWQTRGQEVAPARTADGPQTLFDPDEGDPVPATLETFAVLTTAPNALIAPIHDRMPVILPPDSFAAWLDAESTPLALALALLKPCAPVDFVAYPVGPQVNNPRHDDPACAQPIPVAGSQA